MQEQPNFAAAESAKLDEEIDSLTKEVEESKADLEKLKLQKMLALERLELTKKNGNKQQARLMLVTVYVKNFFFFFFASKQMHLSYFFRKKRCELQMKLFNLKLNKK